MSDAPAPSAPTTNGAGHKAQVPAPSTQPPSKDVATGQQTPSPATPGRAPDGKFTASNPKPPEDDDPEMDFGSTRMKRSVALREIERSKSTAQLLTAAEKRHNEAIRREKALDEARSKAKSGDIGALLQNLDLSPEQERQYLARYLHDKHIVPESMDPTQRELAELKAKLAAREEKEKGDQDKLADLRKQQSMRAEAKKLEAQVIEAAKTGKLPSAPAALRRIIAKAEAYDSRGMELPLEQVASIVREEIAAEMAECIESMDIEDRKELLGAERFRAEEQKWLAHFQGKLPKANPIPIQRAVKPQQSNGESKSMTPREFASRMWGK